MKKKPNKTPQHQIDTTFLLLAVRNNEDSGKQGQGAAGVEHTEQLL